MSQPRGKLTDRIKAKSMELLGYEIDVTELRMMPYVFYVMQNKQRVDPSSCNAADREVLSKWRGAGHIEGGASNMLITKEFWDIMSELIFLGYVDIE